MNFDSGFGMLPTEVPVFWYPNNPDLASLIPLNNNY